ncbi:MAG: hypothetical protein ACREEK_17590 [Bradyrhizobium sp.]
MKRLILTSTHVRDFTEPEFADLAVDFFFRFGWGQQPSPDELVTYLGPRTVDVEQGKHWSDFAMKWGQCDHRDRRDLSLTEFCQQYETVELWFDTRPNAQLTLIWLLDYFRSYPETVERLKFRLIDLDMIQLDVLGKWQPPTVEITDKELETASSAWRAYAAPTPQACFDLLGKDLSALPLLKPVLVDLLEELPSSSTGLGASEMRMLELIGRGYSLTNALFHLYQLRQTRIYGEWEYGYLLDGLAFGPRPAIAGLDEELRTLGREQLRSRHDAYLRSELSLTEFGKAVLAGKEDFSRHNPIDRWWGGTHLTNDNLWRWNPALVAPGL